MSRSTPYIIVSLLLAGAVLVWWLPPVRLPPGGAEPPRRPSTRPTATPTATPPATAPEPPTAAAAE